MSSQHLTEGSERPPMEEGKLRLYSMEYCPFAQRARLVLLAKNLPHDIVNVNLTKKPEWIYDVNPEGKVPALDTGEQVITGSVDIAMFLDEQYPDGPLLPTDEDEKTADKALIDQIDGITSIFNKIVFGSERKLAKEWLDECRPTLQAFEDELVRRGTTYFGGDKPGMVDYMLWPWAERAGTVAIVLAAPIPLTDTDFPSLRAWRKAMRNDSVVNSIYHGPEKFYRIVMFAKKPDEQADYDSI